MRRVQNAARELGFNEVFKTARDIWRKANDQ
jgi:hypothetical protein